MMLTKEQIFAARNLRKVEVPEWGGFVYVRPLSIAEEAEMAALAATAETAPDMERTRQIAIRLVEWAVCDEGGRPIFGEGDLERLRDMQGSALRRLADAILHHSGLTESARRELEKNSPGAPSGA